ncbi:DUF2846 domain-containing protein [Teredinibacter sp. KSP-S5-2]|uniref:DUF2846 domain-containing protein n=1 Tax=Teredinibacter sp. KSP-S5-2 TaxID=3034506 RepID=UPI002934B1AC|nr:DUF2846 domain-containing protein [Teredinibacter sp. KSP-S5-2]WNO09750.1 DUF2846 domain-containing protein [Teredinibacter sp. KSP-S5-2]
MKLFKFSFVLALVMSVLSGCAATGVKFSGVESAPLDKGVVYFYRPKMFAGSAVALALVDNGKQFAKIQNGQYLRYVVEPGLHKFHTDTAAIDKEVEFDVEAGKVYYVRTGMRQGMWVGTWYLSRVFEEEALAELQACCKDGSKP